MKCRFHNVYMSEYGCHICFAEEDETKRRTEAEVVGKIVAWLRKRSVKNHKGDDFMEIACGEVARLIEQWEWKK